MALIPCPECSNPVSDKAAACPRCGHPGPAATNPPQAPASASPELRNLILKTLQQEGKIAAIRVYRERTPGAGLAESKQRVEEIAEGRPPGPLQAPSGNGCASIVLGVLFLLAIVALLLYLRMGNTD